MKQSSFYLGFLILFAGGLGVASVAAGRVVSVVVPEGQSMASVLVSNWLSDAGPLFIAGIVLMVAGGVGARFVSKSRVTSKSSSSAEPSQILELIADGFSDLDVTERATPDRLSEIW